MRRRKKRRGGGGSHQGTGERTKDHGKVTPNQNRPEPGPTPNITSSGGGGGTPLARIALQTAIVLVTLIITLFPSADMRMNGLVLFVGWALAWGSVATSEYFERKPKRHLLKWTGIVAAGWLPILLGAFFYIRYENEPHLSADMDFFTVGNVDHPTPHENSYFTFAMRLKNNGAPTTITNWRLEVTVPGQKSIQGVRLPMEHGFHTIVMPNGSHVDYSGDEDDLASKVKEHAFGRGDRPTGYLQFVVISLPYMAPRAKGTRLHMSFSDDLGHEGVFDYITGGQSLSFQENEPYFWGETRPPLNDRKEIAESHATIKIEPKGNNQALPEPLGTDHPLRLNFMFENSGDGGAKNYKLFSQVHLEYGNPGVAATIEHVWEEFSQWMRETDKSHGLGSEMPAGVSFWSTSEPPFITLTKAQIADIKVGKAHIFLTVSIPFEDEGGDRRQEACFFIQEPADERSPWHDCGTHDAEVNAAIRR